MFHDPNSKFLEADFLAQLGTDAVAYMREMTAEEIAEKFADIPDLETGVTYWALFAADGTPMMLAGDRNDLTHSAFYNDLTAILPN